VRVADLVTHRLPLEEAARAFRLALEGGDALKVVLEP
jgi:threonine dehydrogenase-like Zn-dependent dehydrogenase